VRSALISRRSEPARKSLQDVELLHLRTAFHFSQLIQDGLA
jgi:hypothetical protein